MRINRVPPRPPGPRTHEGAPATKGSVHADLTRSVLSCMLWEDTFYESGVEIATRINSLVELSDPVFVQQLAVKARLEYNLRHAPLHLIMALIEAGKTKPNFRDGLKETIETVCVRPDEPAELLAMYWDAKKRPLSKQLQRGLAAAFAKFSEYGLAKYNRPNKVKLRDVMFMSHPKPTSEAQAATFARVASDTLNPPDTWERLLTEAHDTKAKREVWMKLIIEGKLGALAMLRNLRNMQQVGVADSLIATALREMNTERVLPYRFLTAVRYAPNFAYELERAMFKNLADSPRLTGETIVLVDISGSMDCQMSGKSEMLRWEAAAGLAILVTEMCDNTKVYTFSREAVKVPHTRGFALTNAIRDSQHHGNTLLGRALTQIPNCDRLIIITDEQSFDKPVFRNPGMNYLINVAPYANGISYDKQVIHLDGFSEAALKWILEYEKEF